MEGNGTDEPGSKNVADLDDLLSVEIVVRRQDPVAPTDPYRCLTHIEVVNHAQGLLEGESITIRMSVDYLDSRGNLLRPLDENGEWTGGYGTAVLARFTSSRRCVEEVLPYSPVGVSELRTWTLSVRKFTSPTRSLSGGAA